MAHKSGFVNILGLPNAGKSTLMNGLLGEKLSIITPKAQTTRHRILGILSEDDFQIVFSDTPGILKPHYKLHESMLRATQSAMEDADILIYVADIAENPAESNDFLKQMAATEIPVILLINKIDLSDQEHVMLRVDEWQKVLPKAQVLPVSALRAFNLSTLLTMILEKLPEGAPYYEKDELSDKNERFFVSEIIREKILKFYEKEIPYSVEVVVEEYKEDENFARIRAIIYVARESQKGILIGHKGVALKKVGTLSRIDIEKFINKKVFLELYVKIDKDWRNKEKSLNKFGYNK